MKKLPKKILALALCLLMVALSACGSSGDKAAEKSPADSSQTSQPSSADNAPKEKTKLTMWHYWTTEADGNAVAFAKVLEGFGNDNPDIDLEVTGQSASDYWTKLKVAFAANEAPDLMNLQAPSELTPFVEANKLLAINDMIDKYGTENSILPGTLNNFTVDGKVYGLPTITALGLLYCNSELFEKYNLDYPETYSDLLNCAKVFNDNGVTPVMCAGKDMWPAMFYYDILAIRYGGAELCQSALNGKVSFENEAFVKAAATLQEMVDAGVFRSTDLALGWDEGISKFINGGAAMLYNGTWVTGVVRAEDSPIRDKVVLLNFPSVEGGAGDANEFFGGAFECFSINAKVNDKDAAFKVISYLCEKMSNVSLVTGNGLPAWKSDEINVSELDPFIAAQYELATTATDYCLWWDTALGGKKADYHKSLVIELLTKSITPEEFAAKMQKINTGLDE